MFSSFRELIDEWTQRNHLAAAIGATGDQVRHWYVRDFIPCEYWAALTHATHGSIAARREMLEQLAKLASRRINGGKG